MTMKINTLKSIAIAVTLSCGALSLSAVAHDTHSHKTTASVQALEKGVAGEHRTANNKARDKYRHPIETLSFFGFSSNMTVVEITPGGGWYTEILAPALKELEPYMAPITLIQAKMTITVILVKS